MMKFATIAFVLIEAFVIAPAFAVDTVWDFNGNINATSGTCVMTYRGDTASGTTYGTTASLGLAAMYGDDGTGKVMAFPATTSSQGFTVTSGSATASQYTMIWDVYYGESTDKKFRSLLQTNAANSNDADLFVNNRPWGGVGISSVYHGAIVPNSWNRIAITRESGGVLKEYINGGYVGQQTLSASRWTLDASYDIFTDDSGETQPGYVSSYRYVNSAMSQQAIFDLGGVNAKGATVAGQIFKDASISTPGSFTIAVLGDSQSYSESATYASTFSTMTQWLVNNKTSRNIKFVTHEGDFTTGGGTTAWNNAMTAMDKLNGQLPYAVVPGNHDYNGGTTRNLTTFDTHFGAGSAYASQTTLDGYYADPNDANSRANTYHTFEANGQNYLVLALELGARDSVVDWAKNIVTSHAGYKTILLTHAYMNDGGALFNAAVDPTDPQGRTYDQIRAAEVGHDEAKYNPQSYSWVGSGGNDGQELWDKIVKGSNGMSLVLSGHQFDELDGYPYLMTTADDGDPVYQMLFNTQDRQAGGEGWIRLLEFQPDGQTIVVKTYSPSLDQWSYASDEYYTITIPEPSTLCLLTSLLATISVAFVMKRRKRG